MKYKISFVIPAYNSEKYLKRCIDSLLMQDISSQIIIVNDGSTDKTEQICLEYKNKYSNVVYIPLKNNQGVSNARNKGIEMASGEFVFFVDSDDYIDKTGLYKILDQAYEHDMIIFSKIYDYSGNLKKCKIPYDGEISVYDLMHNNLDIFLNVHTSCWVTNKLYKTEIIKKNNVLFDTTIEFAEDLMFNLLYFKFCNSVIFKEEFISIYNRNVENSLSRKYEAKNITEIIKQRKNLLLYLKEQKINNLSVFYKDTKNILVYAVKKVLLNKYITNKEKTEQLNAIKHIDKKILQLLNKQNSLELLLHNFVFKNNLKILEWKNEEL